MVTVFCTAMFHQCFCNSNNNKKCAHGISKTMLKQMEVFLQCKFPSFIFLYFTYIKKQCPKQSSLTYNERLQIVANKNLFQQPLRVVIQNYTIQMGH